MYTCTTSTVDVGGQESRSVWKQQWKFWYYIDNLEIFYKNVCPINEKEVPPPHTHTSTIWLPKQGPNKGSVNSHANLEVEISLSPTHRQRTTGTRRLLRKREIASPRDEPPKYLSNTKWSALETTLTATVSGFSWLFYVFICMCVYVCTCIFNSSTEKRSCIWEGIEEALGVDGGRKENREVL